MTAPVENILRQHWDLIQRVAGDEEVNQADQAALTAVASEHGVDAGDLIEAARSYASFVTDARTGILPEPLSRPTITNVVVAIENRPLLDARRFLLDNPSDPAAAAIVAIRQNHNRGNEALLQLLTVPSAGLKPARQEAVAVGLASGLSRSEYKTLLSDEVRGVIDGHQSSAAAEERAAESVGGVIKRFKNLGGINLQEGPLGQHLAEQVRGNVQEGRGLISATLNALSMNRSEVTTSTAQELTLAEMADALDERTRRHMLDASLDGTSKYSEDAFLQRARLHIAGGDLNAAWFALNIEADGWLNLDEEMIADFVAEVTQWRPDLGARLVDLYSAENYLLNADDISRLVTGKLTIDELALLGEDTLSGMDRGLNWANVAASDDAASLKVKAARNRLGN